MLISIMSNNIPTHPAPQVKGAPRLSAIEQSEGGSPPELVQHVSSLGGSGFEIAHDLVAFANQSILHIPAPTPNPNPVPAPVLCLFLLK